MVYPKCRKNVADSFRASDKSLPQRSVIARELDDIHTPFASGDSNPTPMRKKTARNSKFAGFDLKKLSIVGKDYHPRNT